MNEQHQSSPTPTSATTPAHATDHCAREHSARAEAHHTSFDRTQAFPQPQIRVISTKEKPGYEGDDWTEDPNDIDEQTVYTSSFDDSNVSGSVYIKQKKGRGCGFFIALLLIAVIGAALGTAATLYGLKTPQGHELLTKVGLGNLVGEEEQRPVAPLEASDSSNEQVNPDADRSEQVAAQAMPSVARVSAITKKGTSIGSGVVYDADGHIVTNYHVIADAQSVSVHLDGKTYPAQIMGEDPETDLAVLKVDATDLKPLPRADSDKIKVGEWVMAIGSPFGLESTVTTGIVSSPQRSTTMPSAAGITIYASLIQTDAAINMGNSGGALVNKHGELVGINTLIYSNSGSSAGIGFAIPTNYASQIADQIIAGKPVEHTYLGVSMTTVSIRDASKFGGQTSAAMVEDVEADSAAGKAGLVKGDVVLSFNGEPITSADDLVLKVRRAKAGDKAKLTIYRDKTMEVEVTLGSKASQSQTQNFHREDTPQGDFLPLPNPSQPNPGQNQDQDGQSSGEGSSRAR